MYIDCLFVLRDAGDCTAPRSIHQVLLKSTSNFEKVKAEAISGLNIDRNISMFYTDDEDDEIRVGTTLEIREAFSVAAVEGAITFFVDVLSTEPVVEHPETSEQEEEEKELVVEQEQEEEEPKKEMNEIHVAVDGSLANIISQFQLVGDGKEFDVTSFINSLEDNEQKEQFLQTIAEKNPLGLPLEVAKCWVTDDEDKNVVCEKQQEQAAEEEEEEMKGTLHRSVVCDGCDKTIRGIRYKCFNCADYDLCEVCESSNLANGTHDAEHLFIKIYKPVTMPFEARDNVYQPKPKSTYRRCPRFNNNTTNFVFGNDEKPYHHRSHHRGGRWRKRREEVDNKISALEQLCAKLSSQIEQIVSVPQQVVEEPIVVVKKEEKEVVAKSEEPSVVVVEIDADEPNPIADSICDEDIVVVEEDVAVKEEEQPEKNLLEQSMAGLTPEAMIAFDCLVNMGFTDYPLIATLLREHAGEIQKVVAGLVAAGQ